MKEYQNWLSDEEGINGTLTEKERDLTHVAFKASLEWIFDELDRRVEEKGSYVVDISDILESILEELKGENGN